ncbi:peptide/nickel transport system permease protein [Kroppenstedtia sanguinis]|uniref:ABC transporter permease subunit n=1 Tax=Kroppenstedtia sanguinis TaxID=1380684 RepID=A0ABW4CAQ8_9BACL
MIKSWKIGVWIGGGMLAIFVLLACVGPTLTPYTPNEERAVEFKNVNGSTEVTVAPAPPSQEHWFGTDRYGRDLLTLYLYGLKYTVFVPVFIVFFQLLFGVCLGCWMGLSGRRPLVSHQLMGGLGSIPVIIVLYFLLYGLGTNTPVPILYLILFQSIILVVMGIGPVASAIQQRTEELKERLSFVASLHLGAPRQWLIRKHILPFLKEDILLLFLKNMISTLNLIGQLSVLGLFLGGSIKKESPGGLDYVSRSFETMGLVAQERAALMANHDWLILCPLGGYLLLLAAWYLLLSAIEKKVRRNYSQYPYI